MSDAYGGGLGRERDSRGASAARRLAAEIVPKWSGASAANTMEYETALRAIMVEGHGPVEGLLAAVYFGDVDETKEGYLKYQLLRLGAGSDEEGPLEAASDDDWGADPVAAFEASRRHKVKAQEPTELHVHEARGTTYSPSGRRRRSRRGRRCRRGGRTSTQEQELVGLGSRERRRRG